MIVNLTPDEVEGFVNGIIGDSRRQPFTTQELFVMKRLVEGALAMTGSTMDVLDEQHHAYGLVCLHDQIRDRIDSNNGIPPEMA